MEKKATIRSPKSIYVIPAVLAALVVAGVFLGRQQRLQARRNVEAQVRTWPDAPRLMAELMMERYGPPNVIAQKTATWHEQGPWKRIVVHGDSRENYLEQTVGYLVRPEALEPLRRLGRGVRADPELDELSAASGSEALNYLALNIADEVAAGKRGVEDARNFYDLTAKLSRSGKKSPYLEDLLFQPYRVMAERGWRREIGY